MTDENACNVARGDVGDENMLDAGIESMHEAGDGYMPLNTGLYVDFYSYVLHHI